MLKHKLLSIIENSNYISRDLSWMQFNYRVLDQAFLSSRNLFDRLKFLAITSSNLDEFFMIRIGSLYNYIDYKKSRIDYSGLREVPFKQKLLAEAELFIEQQNKCYKEQLVPEFEKNDFKIVNIGDLSEVEKNLMTEYFERTLYPILTPMVYDGYHAFPILVNRLLVFGFETMDPEDPQKKRRFSFMQIPQNLPRFFEIVRGDTVLFLPIEQIIRWHADELFENMEILSMTLFRITRNGDFTLDESDDIESNFLEEVKRKLKKRKTGRVVRVEVYGGFSRRLINFLKKRWDIDDDNIFETDTLIDFTSLWQIVNHERFHHKLPPPRPTIPPLSCPDAGKVNMFEYLKEHDVLIHTPYNSIEPLIKIVEDAADDPKVLSIKITIYRLAKNSRVAAALLKAAENGKYVSVLFEVKARFDEENNIRQAQRLQKAGCFVIYGVSNLKTHTKLLLIVRKEGEKVTRYVHLSSGNYNEITASSYSDVGILSSDETYAEDVSKFFNVITGHSKPLSYQNLIAAPNDLRKEILKLIRTEINNKKNGIPAGIAFKVNSLEDKTIIDELYKASQVGVKVRLIIRGICCLRPGRQGLSEHIMVRSIVGDYLEHTRLYYFHNGGNPSVYGASADLMVRSFERRVESMFLITNENLKKEVINILVYNLRDNVNSYDMKENGEYVKKHAEGTEHFDIYEEFYKLGETASVTLKEQIF